MAVAPSPGAQFEAILQSLCNQHDFHRGDFIEAFEDLSTGHINLFFRPRQYSPELVQMANQLHHTLSDTFRGEVVRSAVPEFSKQAGELADAILNPKRRVITFDPAPFNYKHPRFL